MKVQRITSQIPVVAAALICLAAAESASGQAVTAPVSMFAGSEDEQYLRFAQTLAPEAFDPWSIRGMTRTQQKRIATIAGSHPWQARISRLRTTRIGYGLLPARADIIVNSTFPYGSNDGAVWAGRGLTTVFQGGVYVQWNRFSLILAPVISRAENGSFPLMNNGKTGRLEFADGQFPDVIDRPQRFGASAYQIVDPGQSTLAFDGFGISAGISSANQAWGPAERFQFILGNNSAGYPHIFLGSAQPVDVGIAKIHGRLVWGMLEQSAYSPVSGPQYFESGTNPGRRRFTAGMIATVQPKVIPGMEVGASRFFHRAWPQGGLGSSDFTSIFQNVFKKSLPREAPLPGSDNTQGVRDNQLFSFFTRWVAPGTGFEAYGEFGRDDHSYDARDFLQEPDHGGASRMVGLRKMWNNGYALRAEAINYESPPLTKFRGEGSVYLHYVLRQGHTQKGQPLGADAGMGSGAGSFVSADKYDAQGRTTLSWARNIGHRSGSYYLGGEQNLKSPDVLHTLSAEMLRFRGALEVLGKVNLTTDFNRYFQSDVLNVNLQLGVSRRF